MTVRRSSSPTATASRTATTWRAGSNQQKNAVLSGYWPLMRYNPGLRVQGKNPFQLDSKAPSIPFRQYAYNEARYTMLVRSNPLAARELLKMAQDDVERQWRVYSNRAAMLAAPRRRRLRRATSRMPRTRPNAGGDDE